MKTRITELLGIQYPIIQGGMPPARRGSRHDPEPVDAARDRTLC